MNNDDLLQMQQDVANCKKDMNFFKKKLDIFFKDFNCYNCKQLAKKLEISEKKVEHLCKTRENFYNN